MSKVDDGLTAKYSLPGRRLSFCMFNSQVNKKATKFAASSKLDLEKSLHHTWQWHRFVQFNSGFGMPAADVGMAIQ